MSRLINIVILSIFALLLSGCITISMDIGSKKEKEKQPIYYAPPPPMPYYY